MESNFDQLSLIANAFTHKSLTDKNKKKMEKQASINKIIFKKKINSIKSIIASDEYAKFFEIHDMLVDNRSNEKFNQSIDFFNSLITLSDWYEDLKDGSCFGILVELKTNNLAKIGLMYDIKITSTTTFLSVDDYLSSFIQIFKINKNNKNDGNLNNISLINQNIIGRGNFIIPLYINKHHWKLSKIFMEPMLGMALTHNPFSFTNNHENIMFHALFNMLNDLLTENNININNKTIITTFSFLRTCAQVCFDKKYQRGLIKYINKFIINRSCKKYSDELLVKIFGQSLSTGTFMEQSQFGHFVKSCIMDFINNSMINNNISKKYINTICNYNDNELNEELVEISSSITSNYENELYDILMYDKMSKLFKQIYHHFGSYSSFIKNIDSGYGVCNINDITIIKKILTQNVITSDNEINNIFKMSINDFYKKMNVEYDKFEILFWVIKGAYFGKKSFKKINVKYDKLKHNSIKNIIEYITNA
jgi:hypothetical protein